VEAEVVEEATEEVITALEEERPVIHAEA